jgi:hypothetical protein
MALHPLHPDEPALHRELRDALNRRLANTNFFVWIKVIPTGMQQEFADLDRVVRGIEWWLDSLDPDAIPTVEPVPELELADPAADILVRALPKKRAARKRRSAQIVGNPEPVLVGWGHA